LFLDDQVLIEGKREERPTHGFGEVASKWADQRWLVSQAVVPWITQIIIATDDSTRADLAEHPQQLAF
jgi:hypothetical protein